MAFSFISCLDQPFNEKTLSVISAKFGVYYKLHSSKISLKEQKKIHTFEPFFAVIYIFAGLYKTPIWSQLK